MKALAWDTSSKAGAIVAMEWDPASRLGWEGVRLVSEWSLDVDLTHSERLLWAIDQILESARWKLSDLDYLGVGVGPGSFTGLRIGLTVARTLGHFTGKPVAGVSSLSALARPAALLLGARSDALVVSTTDACKGELFVLCGSASAVSGCVTRANGDAPGLWGRGVFEEVLAPTEFLSKLKSRNFWSRYKSWTAIGEGRSRYPDFWKKLPAKKEKPPLYVNSHQIQGRYLGMLVWEAIQAGLARPALEMHPRYLRKPDAQVKLEAGLLPPGPWRGMTDE